MPAIEAGSCRYTYAVNGNRNSNLSGVIALQYSTAMGSEMDTEIRSEIPRKARTTAAKAVTGEGLLKSVTCG